MRKALLITANVGEQEKGGTAHICTTQIIGIMWECVLPALVLRVSLFTSFFNLVFYGWLFSFALL